MHEGRSIQVCLALLCVLSVQGKSSTLGRLDEFLEDNALAGTCANGVCTTSTGHEYSEVFEAFVPEFFAGAKDITGLLETAKSAGETGDMSQIAALAGKHQKEVQKKLAPYVAQIYDQFVHPSSPGVDPETCRSIVREFLVACKRHMPLLARQSMEAGAKFGAMMADSAGVGEASAKLMAEMQQHMSDYMPQVSKTMGAVMDELATRSESMADEIFEQMDGNKDGVVDRKEFDKSFASAMQQIVNMQALAQTAQKVMEQISPADLEQLSKLLDADQLKALSQMDPEDLLRQIQQLGGAGGLGGLGGLGGMPGMPGMPKAGGRKGRLPPLAGKLK